MSARRVERLEIGPGRSVLLTGDLHLEGPGSPEAELFLAFAREAASPDRTLVVAGDLFYYYFENARKPVERFRWLLDELAEAAEGWGGVVRMHGNRDFLLGGTRTFPDGLATAGDFLLLDFGGRRALATHGDLFLRGDRAYYAFRRFMRSAPAVWFTRHVPPALGVRLADGLRWISFRRGKDRGFAPPDYDKIRAAAAEHGADEVYFGHFHRAMEPSDFPFDEPACWCLGAWEEGAAPVLEADAGGVRLTDARDFVRHGG